MSLKNRILVVLHEESIGGATQAVLRTLPLLEARGWEFVFWVPSPGSAREELTKRGYECGGEPRLLRYSRASLQQPPGAAARLRTVPGYLSRFRRWALSQRPVLVHANTIIALPELAAVRPGGPTGLMHVHELLLDRPKDRVAGRLIRLAADHVIANSAASVAALRREGVSARLVYNGVQLPDPVPVRQRQDTRVIVGVLGTISRRKGTDLFVAAARAVRESPAARGLEIDFRMVGSMVEGPERGWAEAVVATGRSEGMSWSIAPDPFAELAEWDLLVMPSRVEPFGLAAAEAMATGIPVLAAATGGLRELISRDAGRLVAPENVGALADAIVDLALRPELRRELGSAGRRRVEKHFTLERQAEATHVAYLEATQAPTSS